MVLCCHSPHCGMCGGVRKCRGEGKFGESMWDCMGGRMCTYMWSGDISVCVCVCEGEGE